MFHNSYFIIIYSIAVFITFLIAYRYDYLDGTYGPALIWPVALLAFIMVVIFNAIDALWIRIGGSKLKKVHKQDPKVKRRESFNNLKWAVRFALNDGVSAEDVLHLVENAIVSDVMNS